MCFCFVEYDAKQVSDALAWLQFSREPWPEVLEKWEVTYQHRKKDIFGHKKATRDQSLIFSYLAKYPILKCKTGYQLVSMIYYFIIIGSLYLEPNRWVGDLVQMGQTGLGIRPKIGLPRDFVWNWFIAEIWGKSHLRYALDLLYDKPLWFLICLFCFNYYLKGCKGTS